MMHIVYYTDTGEAESIGSVLADPMPPQFSVYDCTDEETTGLYGGTMTWDPDTRTIIPIPPA